MIGHDTVRVGVYPAAHIRQSLEPVFSVFRFWWETSVHQNGFAIQLDKNTNTNPRNYCGNVIAECDVKIGMPMKGCMNIHSSRVWDEILPELDFHPC